MNGFSSCIITAMTVALVSAHSFSTSGQGDDIPFQVPRTNAFCTVKQRVAATDIEVSYHQPNAGGREIFGVLVPYGKVWRTGADEATKITFSTEVLIEGNALNAGNYELFTVPGEETWDIIFQEDRSRWGAYSYTPENDVLRVSVDAKKSGAHVETFTISFDSVRTSMANMNIAWGQVTVPLKITIDLNKTVIPKLEKAVATADRPPYFQAAMFYFDNNIDVDRAAELMALALKQNPGHIGMQYRQALILERKGDINGARTAAQQSLEGAMNSDEALREEYTRLNTILLQRLDKTD